MTRYRTIVADPPWPYGAGQPRGVHTIKRDGQTALGVSSKALYGEMSIAELCDLRPDVDTDAHLYLWTTNAFIADAHRIAEAWGFKQKTCLTWVKVHQDDPTRVSMKTGHYFRGATEHCIFCVRGSQPLTTSTAYPTAFLWPRLPHSVKPDAFYDLVETVSPGPYLELFSRRARLGWDTWGDESLHGGVAHGEVAS